MRFKKSLYCLLIVMLYTCHLISQDTVYIELKTDDTPSENSWAIFDENGGQLFSDNGEMTEPNFLYKFNLVVDAGQCLRFEIYDEGGNGIGNGGYYGIKRNNFWYANFINNIRGYAYHIMGDCDEGKTCDNPLPVNALLMYHPGTDNHWYTITEEENTFYDISTCLNRGLDTRMYIYDTCPSELTSTPEGALAYSDDFIACSPGSGFTSFLFEANKQYYIRIEIVENPDPVIAIKFISKLENLGCMDPQSCNYNPLANADDGSCIYQADCGPDLAISKEKFANSLMLDKYILEDTCLIEEKCVTGLGERDIVRFTTAIYNIGNADYVVGLPFDNAEGFSRDNCHEHWHQLGYAEYLLYAGAGQPEPIGFKNGFCVLDIACDSVNTKYSCGYMGITAGCYDEYDVSIDCQWIDLTDVEDGDYTMVARVNWKKLPDARGMDELNYENNWAQVCINLDRSSGELVLTVNDSCPEYRDCFDVAFGSAIEDCSGACGGTAHHGDINIDGEITKADIDFYLAEIGNGVIESSSCTDLDGNGFLSIYDACLLEECLSTYDSINPWHQHCLFPSGLNNDALEATFSMMEIDPVENSIIVGLENLDSEVRAFHFRLSGVDEISHIEDMTGSGLVPHWSRELDVFMMSKTLPSGPEAPLVKIFYNNQISPEICLSEVVDVVNTSYQKIVGQIGIDNCFINTSVQESSSISAEISIHPNPTTDKIFIDTKGRVGITMKLITLDGVVVREVELKSRNEIDLNDLSEGLYLAQFSNGVNSLVHLISN